MSVSLNEVEATAKRAVRGAGYSWGIAEDAGKATRWLCTRGIDATGGLVRLLGRDLAADIGRHAPQSLNDLWVGDGELCPLTAGASLSDCAKLLNAAPIRMCQVAFPVYLLPFAANAARVLKSCVTVECDGISAVTDGVHLSFDVALSDMSDVATVFAGGTLSNARAHHSRAMPDPGDWAALNRFAHRTYAPATAESRLLGAGAGLSDND